MPRPCEQPGTLLRSRQRRIGNIALQSLLLVNLPIAITVWAQFPEPPSHVNRTPSNTCSLPGLAPDSERKWKSDELLAAYNSQAALIHSLEASMIVRAQSGLELSTRVQDSEPSAATLNFVAPASLRVMGIVPFSGRRTFDLSSDGREFRLLVPDGKLMRLFVGPVDAPATSTNPRENLRPQPIIDALHWLQAQLEYATGPSAMKGSNARTIDVTWMAAATGTRENAQVEFDLGSGTVSRLVILDAAGKAATEVDYSDWQPVPASKAGQPSICIAKRMLVVEPQQNLRLEMKMLGARVNLPITPQQLRLVPPRGIAVTRLPAVAHGNH